VPQNTSVNPPSIDKICSAREVLDKLINSRLSMMPMLRENRPIETVSLAEREISALEYVYEAINAIEFISFYLSLDNAINKAIATNANHLIVTITLGDETDYSKSNYLQTKIAR
jgi:hypothetical protein